jgi:hypothetical protein
MDVNEHERLSIITIRHKLKYLIYYAKLGITQYIIDYISVVKGDKFLTAEYFLLRPQYIQQTLLRRQ